VSASQLLPSQTYTGTVGYLIIALLQITVKIDAESYDKGLLFCITLYEPALLTLPVAFVLVK